MAKILINTFFILIFTMSFPFFVLSEEIYEFERMWPVIIGQPWYFFLPTGVTVDSQGNVYVADAGNNRIEKFTSDGQFMTNWGNRGNEDGQFNLPSCVAIDSSGYVYVADTLNHRIQKFTSEGQFITKWGSAGSGDGQFNSPYAIAADSSGNVYVADTENHRVQKFTSNGQFIARWGSYGSGNGQFNYLYGIQTDSNGHVYVSDYWNGRIQKFASNGQFIAKWGSMGSGDGEFSEPVGMAIDSSGYVYVSDKLNGRIQKFTSEGQFVAKWGSWGGEDGEFNEPWGISIDSKGYVYAADKKNDRIQKFTSSGQFITKWGSAGSEDGQFHYAEYISMDSSGYVYVSDYWNQRVQKFASNGQFITRWGSYGSGDGQFCFPEGIAIDSSGNIYVVDQWNQRVQKFTSNGQFIAKWGSEGSEDGQFYYPRDIAIDNSGYAYVADSRNQRIQKFTLNGQFISKWGSQGSADGQFDTPYNIYADRSGVIYVADAWNHRIQKFTLNGQFISKWGSQGNGDGQFYIPRGINVDDSGYVYVVDSGNGRIQKFTSDGQFIAKWGSSGSNPGEFSNPIGISISSDGKVFISDTGNNRIQVFSKVAKASNNKAIIVAGSGPYKGNNLWDATEMNASFAFRVLTYQGYTNDTIYYLSSDRKLDLNGDGKPDVDADATKSNLQSAITQWAKDAESLVVYLTGHGGDGTFRISEAEILRAEDLALWLNELQDTMQGLVTIVYDACESGSFVSKLAPPSGKQRILITSTSPGEPAYFLSQGALSFSYPFWSQIFGGAKIYDAYVMAKDVVGVAIGAGKSQNPEIDDNGNGIGNEKDDGDLARNKYIGKGFVTAGDIPLISTISQDQVLNGQTSATITVEVVSAENVTKVWGVVYSPNFINTPGNPITDLPSFDLTCIDQEKKKFQGTYYGFTVAGTYTLTVYAMNEETIISLPMTIKIEQVLSNQYTLIVTIAPSNAAGSVSKNPNKSIYTNGEAVTLTVSPNSGYTFTNWTGDVPNPPNPNSSIQIIMNGTKNVTANFIQNQYTLTVNIAPPGTGSVTKNPDKASYGHGETVQLTATTTPGFTFNNWSGDASGSTNPITLTMNGNKTVVANFIEENAPDISVTPWTYDFGDVKVKKVNSASCKVQNNGKANLTVATLIIGRDASMFKLTGGGGNKTIKSGKFLTLKITFKPTSKGAKQATLRITSNDPDTSLIDIPLSGAGQ